MIRCLNGSDSPWKVAYIRVRISTMKAFLYAALFYSATSCTLVLTKVIAASGLVNLWISPEGIFSSAGKKSLNLIEGCSCCTFLCNLCREVWKNRQLATLCLLTEMPQLQSGRGHESNGLWWQMLMVVSPPSVLNGENNVPCPATPTYLEEVEQWIQ